MPGLELDEPEEPPGGESGVALGAWPIEPPTPGRSSVMQRARAVESVIASHSACVRAVDPTRGFVVLELEPAELPVDGGVIAPGPDAPGDDDVCAHAAAAIMLNDAARRVFFNIVVS